jgi:uncharacterized protein
MSTYTLYDASVGNMKDGLASLKTILQKAESTASAKGTDMAALLTSRLHEDMLPLTFQVHVVSDVAQKTVARCTGKEPESWPYDELKTLEDCYARIDKALGIVNGVSRDAIDAGADNDVPCGMGPGKTIHMKAKEYVNAYALPNFFFHISTAYGILRSKGIELGKGDYLGCFIGRYM